MKTVYENSNKNCLSESRELNCNSIHTTFFKLCTKTFKDLDVVLDREAVIIINAFFGEIELEDNIIIEPKWELLNLLKKCMSIVNN